MAFILLNALQGANRTLFDTIFAETASGGNPIVNMEEDTEGSIAVDEATLTDDVPRLALVDDKNRKFSTTFGGLKNLWVAPDNMSYEDAKSALADVEDTDKLYELGFIRLNDYLESVDGFNLGKIDKLKMLKKLKRQSMQISAKDVKKHPSWKWVARNILYSGYSKFNRILTKAKKNPELTAADRQAIFFDALNELQQSKLKKDELSDRDYQYSGVMFILPKTA